jgi:hypothetical protein
MALANIEDVEQDLLCELCCAIKNYDHTKGTVAAFCEIVLQHRIRNYLRDRLTKKKGRHAIQIPEEENIPSSNASDQLAESMDADVVIKSLPLHEQIIVSMIQNHSVAETSRFFNASSNEFHYIRRKIQRKIADTLNNKEEKKMQPKNLTAQQISELPINDLAQLNDLINEQLAEVKTMKERLDDGLNLRFSIQLQREIQSQFKNTGTVHFRDNNFKITAEVAKKVTWDSMKFEPILKLLPNIVKISYSIDEKVYLSLPPEHKALIDQARTVTTGKIRYKIQHGADNTNF